MFNRIARFVKNISFILLSLQGKFLQKRLIKRMGYKPNSSVKGCTIDLKKEANEANTEKLNNEVKAVLKRCNNNPQEILKFIQEHRNYIFACVELDIDSIVGSEQVEEWRKKYFYPLEESGVRVIYLYHLDKDLDYFEKF